MIDHMDNLITLVTTEPSYKPNEKDLTAIALNDLLTKLKAANKAVKDADTAYSNSRISRNKLLYADNTGLVPTAGEVKKYVRSVYGASAPEYKQISGLQFKKIDDK